MGVHVGYCRLYTETHELMTVLWLIVWQDYTCTNEPLFDLKTPKLGASYKFLFENFIFITLCLHIVIIEIQFFITVRNFNMRLKQQVLPLTELL